MVQISQGLLHLVISAESIKERADIIGHLIETATVPNAQVTEETESVTNHSSLSVCCGTMTAMLGAPQLPLIHSDRHGVERHVHFESS